MNEPAKDQVSAALDAAGQEAVEGGTGGALDALSTGDVVEEHEEKELGGGPKSGSSGGMQSLDFILDIPLKLTVELGRTKMTVREVLQLAQGAVVELSKFAGEPVEVLVNDKLVARGEVVVVNEKFGVRLTDIISPAERVEQLK